jgi:hypothetical protein
MANNFYIGWGTGSGTASATDVSLFNPVGTVISGVTSAFTTSTSGDTFVSTGLLTADNYYSITEVGLFDSNSSSTVSSLSNQVNPTDTTITVSGYNLFPATFPFNVQVSSEVMEVTSGDGNSIFNVIRGANGSSRVTSIIPALTPVVLPNSNMYIKSTFAGINLLPEDSVLFKVIVQFS